MKPTARGDPAVAVAAGLGLLLAGCAAAPLDRTLDSLSGVADRLVSALERRADTQTLKLLVYDIHPASRSPRSGRYVAMAGPRRDSGIGVLLEHEFVVYLTPRLNIVETEHGSDHGQTAQGAEVDLKAVAARYGATAVLAGDYMEVGDEVYVTVRIIDVDSMLVIAAARGVFSAGSLRALNLRR